MTAAPLSCEGLPPLDGIGAEACLFSSDYVPPTIYTVSDGGLWLEVRSPTLTPGALEEVAANAIARADEVLGQ